MPGYRSDYQAVRSAGGLLPPDVLSRIPNPRSGLEGNTTEHYGLAPGERLNEAIISSWKNLRAHWKKFQAEKGQIEGRAGTGYTNEKWSVPLLGELGFGRLPTTPGPTVEGKSYQISRFHGPTPVHLIGYNLKLDRISRGQRGAARSNPHGMVQEFLNRSDDHLWGIVCNGRLLRVLRDSQALSRQSFLEFDLEAIFDGELYPDFVLLWLTVHGSRFEPQEGTRPESCWLERWTEQAAEQGMRALNELRGGVAEALQKLGQGLTSHPRNERLRQQLSSGELSPDELYKQLLRVIYRLIFLFVAEDRELLHPPEADYEIRRRYKEYYSTHRLRQLADKMRGWRHTDLWQQFRLVTSVLNGKADGELVRDALALPALEGFLWDLNTTVAINDTELTNRVFLRVIRDLAYIQSDDGPRRRVDYRNLGTEELGGVYEGLLALTPQVEHGGKGFHFRELAGNKRNLTGSYYTPPELVQRLLDSALDPVVKAKLKGKKGQEAEEALLSLKVCDPAVGSGHFLIGAAHRLAKHLARVRAFAEGDSEPSLLTHLDALRDVIARCLYGVDINPMAAELCRVSLWLESLTPGKPLAFLDSHIQVGNSLLGTTKETDVRQLPDAAFRALLGDDKKVCSDLKHRNKKERGGHGQIALLLAVAEEAQEEYKGLASRVKEIDQLPNTTLEQVNEQKDSYHNYEKTAERRKAMLLADAWCAAFMWPKKKGAPKAITTDTLWQIIQGGGQGLTPEQHAKLEKLHGSYGFFHWHLAFPDVFEDGGFDCVLGNPPWKRVKLDTRDWFVERNADIAKARNTAGRNKLIKELKIHDPPLYQEYQAALRKANTYSHFLHTSDRYPLCGRGDVNLYAVFTETMRDLLNRTGYMGCIVLTGIATQDTTKSFFRDITKTKTLVSLFDFVNSKKIFQDVHSGMRFCLLTITGQGVLGIESRSFSFLFLAEHISAIDDQKRIITINIDDLEKLNPNTGTCPVFKLPEDAELAKHIYRHIPILVLELDKEQVAESTPPPPEFVGLLALFGCSTCRTIRTCSGLGGNWKQWPTSLWATCTWKRPESMEYHANGDVSYVQRFTSLPHQKAT